MYAAGKSAADVTKNRRRRNNLTNESKPRERERERGKSNEMLHGAGAAKQLCIQRSRSGLQHFGEKERLSPPSVQSNY